MEKDEFEKLKIEYLEELKKECPTIISSLVRNADDESDLKAIIGLSFLKGFNKGYSAGMDHPIKQ